MKKPMPATTAIDRKALSLSSFLFRIKGVLPAVVLWTKLQKEFKPCERHIIHLLRTHHAPEDKRGYQMHDCGDAEVEAVVQAAYLEMLGRPPTVSELTRGVQTLTAKKLNEDGLRRTLMPGAEFKAHFGEVSTDQLYAFRVRCWFDVCDKLIRDTGGMPSALNR